MLGILASTHREGVISSPEGPDTPSLRTQASKTMSIMAFGTGFLDNEVSGPSG